MIGVGPAPVVCIFALHIFLLELMNFSVYVRMLAYSYFLDSVEYIDSRPEMHERRQRGDSQLFLLTYV